MKTVALKKMPYHEKLMTLDYFCDIVRSEYKMPYRLGDGCETIRRALHETIAINEYNAANLNPEENVPNIHGALSHKLLLEYSSFVHSKHSLNDENYDERLKEFNLWFNELLQAFIVDINKTPVR